MYDAYEALPILEKLPLQIDSIAAYGIYIWFLTNVLFWSDVTCLFVWRLWFIFAVFQGKTFLSNCIVA